MKRFGGLYFSFVLLSLFSVQYAQAAVPARTTGFDSAMETAAKVAALGVVLPVVNDFSKNLAVALALYWGISQLQKENSQFFNSTVDMIKSPWVFARKKLELLLCGGESLSWNEIVTWRNRTMRLLSPLTKQTSVVDLSREKRLRLIDQEDNKEETVDTQWMQYARHIEVQLTFMLVTLGKHLNYYETKKKKTLKKQCYCPGCLAEKYIVGPPAKVVGSIGKVCVRVSVKRDMEIAFYLKEVQTYLKEIIEYTKDVKQFQSLDKEHVKRIMNSTCDAFEHIATLIDVSTASSGRPEVGKLSMQREGSTGNGYGGYGSYGGYGGYGSSGV